MYPYWRRNQAVANWHRFEIQVSVLIVNIPVNSYPGAMKRQFSKDRQVRNIDNYITNPRTIVAEVPVVVIVTAMIVPEYIRIAVKFPIGFAIFWMMVIIMMACMSLYLVMFLIVWLSISMIVPVVVRAVSVVPVPIIVPVLVFMTAIAVVLFCIAVSSGIAV